MSLASHKNYSCEELALLNPAFVAVIIQKAAKAYEKESHALLPTLLSFLVPPIVLVKSTRKALPKSISTSFAKWIQQNPGIRMKFAGVAASSAPIVRSGLIYGSSGKLISVGTNGVKSLSMRSKSGSILTKNTDEIQEIVKRASFVGRWYAQAGKLHTIFFLWGIRP